MSGVEFHICKYHEPWEQERYYGPYTAAEKEVAIAMHTKGRAHYTWIAVEDAADFAAPLSFTGPGAHASAYYTILVSGEPERAMRLATTKAPLWRLLADSGASDDHDVLEVYRGLYIRPADPPSE